MKEAYFSQTEWVDESTYRALHTRPLRPTSLRIHEGELRQALTRFEEQWRPWGHRPGEARKGISLVNQSGTFPAKDPACGSLYDWNLDHPNEPYFETNFRMPTPLMKEACFQSLNVLEGHWARSNIMQWQAGDQFKPHIDTLFPAPWLKLWGVTNPENIEVSFFGEDGSSLNVEPMEPGRIYLIDSHLVHSVKCVDKEVYHFFLSLAPSGLSLLKKVLTD